MGRVQIKYGCNAIVSDKTGIKIKELHDNVAATIEKLIEADKPEPKFEPISIHLGCFEVSVREGNVRVKTGKNYSGCCWQDLATVDSFISALQKARNYAEAKKKK